MDVNLNLGRIAQIALGVSDIDRSEKLYATTVGLKHLGRVQNRMTFFDCGGVTLLLSKEGDGPITHGAVIYFSCADLRLSVRELQGRGVAFVEGPTLISRQPAFDLWMAFFKDPDGHMLALHCEAPKGCAPPQN